MILKVTLILLYLILGLWLFISAVTTLGGKSAVYDNDVIFVLSLIIVTIVWPYFLLKAIWRKRNE